MSAKPKEARLSDGRQMRALDGVFTQMQMFDVACKAESLKHAVATMKDADDALTISKVSGSVFGNAHIRTGEYCFSAREPGKPFGSELVFIEKGIRYRMEIPDVRVPFNGKEPSLRAIKGALIIIDSITLLKLTKISEGEYLVSPADGAKFEGRIHAVPFLGKGWVKAGSLGYPDTGKSSSADDPSARHVWMRTVFEDGATGYHGSMARTMGGDGGRSIIADLDWSAACRVAVVGRVSGKK